MSQEFKQCLEGGKIISFPSGKELVGKEIAVAWSDLSDAKEDYEIRGTNGQQFKPFFDLQYEGLSQGVLHIRPRGGLSSLIQTFSAIPHKITERKVLVPVSA